MWFELVTAKGGHTGDDAAHADNDDQDADNVQLELIEYSCKIGKTCPGMEGRAAAHESGR